MIDLEKLEARVKLRREDASKRWLELKEALNQINAERDRITGEINACVGELRSLQADEEWVKSLAAEQAAQSNESITADESSESDKNDRASHSENATVAVLPHLVTSPASEVDDEE